MTPDLVKTFKSNSILAAGFQNPTCMKAMQDMQKNPKEAIQKYKGNAEVEHFLQEFGRVMATHFETMGETSKATQSPNDGKTVATPVQEIGPLQAQAIANSKNMYT